MIQFIESNASFAYWLFICCVIQRSLHSIRMFTMYKCTCTMYISFIAAVTFAINTVFFRLNCYISPSSSASSINSAQSSSSHSSKNSSTSILKCGFTDYFLCLSLLILLPHKRITKDFACLILWRHIFPLCWNRSRQPVSYPVFLLSMVQVRPFSH